MGAEDETADGVQKEETEKRGQDKRETDRGAYTEYGGIGVLMMDVWGNQPWRLDQLGMALAKDGEDSPGFHPRPLLSKRWVREMYRRTDGATRATRCRL